MAFSLETTRSSQFVDVSVNTHTYELFSNRRHPDTTPLKDLLYNKNSDSPWYTVQDMMISSKRPTRSSAVAMIADRTACIMTIG